MLRTLAGVSFGDQLGLRLLVGQQRCLKVLVGIITGAFPAEVPENLLAANMESYVMMLRAKWVPAAFPPSFSLQHGVCRKKKRFVLQPPSLACVEGKLRKASGWWCLHAYDVLDSNSLESHWMGWFVCLDELLPRRTLLLRRTLAPS